MRFFHPSRVHGSTMALYATFLVLVGIPLLALNIDVARVYVAKARLRSATQAACQAYGGMLDYEYYRDYGFWRFQNNSMGMAYNVFFTSMRSGSISINAVKKDGYMLVECRGRSVVSPIMWVGVSFYNQTQYAQVKVKFSTTENWLLQGGE